MKTIEINYREHNIDRFLEIMATSKKFGFGFIFKCRNFPKLYKEFMWVLGVLYSSTENERKAMFHIVHPEHTNKHMLFKNMEPLPDIEKRIEEYSYIETKTLDEVSKSLLFNAVEKLNLTKDQVQACINLASVISSMENKEIKVEHIAEAIQYINTVPNENKSSQDD